MRWHLWVLLACVVTGGPLFAAHNQAPDWMHALVNVSVPAHDEKTNAVLLYSEENLTVFSADKFRSTVRKVYKILRPEGRDYGTLVVPFDSLYSKVTSIHAWCIPASGKDYEVTDKDAAEISPLKGEAGILVTSERAKVMTIPAPEPGNIIGYEYAVESRPQCMQDTWEFQEDVPVRESLYSLTLPAGWEFKTAWFNYPEVKARDAGGAQWQWTIGDVKEIRSERNMPPLRGVAGSMVVTVFPAGGSGPNNPSTWREVGEWYLQKSNGRLEASSEIKQEVVTLTAGMPTPLAKIRALAQFMQRDFRYVAISLKVGGFVPHSAAEVFAHRYGDCKDKVTLMQSMLKEIGIDSFYVYTNVERGAVTPETPPLVGAFDHAVIAIKLPDDLKDPSLIATMDHPKLGSLLIFDPTNETTPFGQIGGYLQANYSLLGIPSASELVRLPQQSATMNTVRRTGNLKLTAAGDLLGDVEEVRLGDRAAREREAFKSVDKSTDEIKPVERLLADSLATYQLTKASVSNVHVTDQPFIWNYSFQAPRYAKSAGNLLLVRPRVLGSKSSALLETPEPRRYPIEFSGPALDSDVFDITLPPGYVVDDLPPAVDADYPFASYHAKTEVVGNVLRYHRTFEVKELSVPVSDAPQLRKFYRIIASDERNTAVLKPSAH